MRVISGKARGTKLVGPDGLETRPTSDRVKESLFSIINFELQDISFLDIFSGSGGIGIEALSRGAKQATFIDSSKAACQSVRSNLEKTKLKDQAKVISNNVQDALNQLGKNNEKFDIIFMDPPYHNNMISQTLSDIVRNNLLTLDGFIIIERPTDYKLEDSAEFTLWKERIYKNTTLSFLKGV